MIHQSNSADETQSIGADLAKGLKAGACLALDGELGAGKTQFVRGLVQGLGGNPRLVSSPTFVLLNIYPTPRFNVYHLDAYRVHGPDDFDGIGFAELLEQNGIVVVEWAARVESVLPATCIHIRFEVTGPTTRQIVID